MTDKYWTTAKGEKYAYQDLADIHLKNIIKDGYRNKYIIDEAKRRGFKIPARPVDKLNFIEVAMWVESFASCAIEGNKLGEYMSSLWNKNKSVFLLELNKILEKRIK
jgi:hypothetical protein